MGIPNFQLIGQKDRRLRLAASNIFVELSPSPVGSVLTLSGNVRTELRTPRWCLQGTGKLLGVENPHSGVRSD